MLPPTNAAACETPPLRQALATRRRSGAPPAHEKLYATAGLIQRKLESKRAAAEAARLKVGSFGVRGEVLPLCQPAFSQCFLGSQRSRHLMKFLT